VNYWIAVAMKSHCLVIRSDWLKGNLWKVVGWCTHLLKIDTINVRYEDETTFILLPDNPDHIDKIGQNIGDLQKYLWVSLEAYKGNIDCLGVVGACIRGPNEGRCARCGMYAKFYPNTSGNYYF
jgi:hypothetical protein